MSSEQLEGSSGKVISNQYSVISKLWVMMRILLLKLENEVFEETDRIAHSSSIYSETNISLRL